MKAWLCGGRRCGNGSLDAVRASFLVAAVLLATTGLSGCAGNDAVADEKAPGAALTAMHEVPGLLAEAGSSRTRTELEMASGGTRITIHGEGVFDYRQRTGKLLVTLPDDPGAERSEPVTELFVPGSLYMKNRGAGVPPDKWVQMETASLPDGNLVSGGATDPVTAAALLGGARSAEDLGEVEIDGEVLRRYRGVIDIEAAAEAAPDRYCRAQLAAAVRGFTDNAVPFYAYLDEEGLLREVRHRFSFAGVRTGEPVSPVGGADQGGADLSSGDQGSADQGSGDQGGGEPTTIEVTSVTVLHDFGSAVDLRMPEPEEIYSGAVVTGG
jgi:hypothetical protein